MLKKIGISCKILVWKGKKPNSNIQKIARDKRYNLLINECNRLNIKTILLGHQMNDLHENFFLRMTRGSGLKGLASFGKSSKLFNIKLNRPLIDIQKKDLEKLASIIFKTFIKDPSNKNDNFKRVRVRKILKEFQIEGLETKKIDLTIKNLKSADDALDYYAKNNVEENAVYNTKNKSYLIKKHFFSHPNEVLLRSMGTILKNISGRYYAPRGKKLEGLISRLNSENNLKKTTLGGCILEKIHHTVIISKE